jgi:formylglycine-generating enzyme required for sulfatase activity
LGIVFYIQTNQGLVKIELSDPTAKVQIQVDGETISITGLDRPLRLRPGEHGLVVSGDDFEMVTRSFTVKRGSDEPLRVTLVPKVEQVVQTPPPPPPVEPLPTPQPKLPPAPSGPLPTITNSIGLQLVQIPAGEFLMGSPDSDSEASSDEKPQHRVQITQPFYLGMFEVTQAQYQRVMGSNPSNFKDDSGLLPVETVSWQDAQEFCAKLSDLTDEKQAGRQYRLPTEAEWEYACRAGTQTKFSFGEDDKDRGEYAWFSGNSGGATHPIGQKKPNEWGLFDMHGNVWEWCADDLRGYTSAPTADLVGSAVASARSLRGGSWFIDGRLCGSAFRGRCRPGDRYLFLGFRVARSSSGK